MLGHIQCQNKDFVNHPQTKSPKNQIRKIMGDDREVLREVWQGRIPTAFTLASEDVTSISPQTFYLMLPRLSYFALATDKVSPFF